MPVWRTMWEEIREQKGVSNAVRLRVPWENPHTCTLYTEFQVLSNSSQLYINKCVNLE